MQKNDRKFSSDIVPSPFLSVRYLAVSVYLILALLLGGTSRSDFPPTIFIEVISVLFIAVAMVHLRIEHARRFRTLLCLSALLVAVPLLHAIPLPFELWSSLPGRELAVEIDDTLGFSQLMRPFSYNENAAWSAFFSLLVPLAALLSMVQLNSKQSTGLLGLWIIASFANGLLSLLQAVGPPDGPLYFYKITNNGWPVGFFANRNHNAVFLACMFPMLATYVSRPTVSEDTRKIMRWLMVVVIVFLVPLILIIGSRAGLVAMIIGIISIPFLFHQNNSIQMKSEKAKKNISLQYIIGIFVVLITILFSFFFQRTLSVDRLTEKFGKSESRLEFWEIVWSISKNYFPTGSGIGSFTNIYNVYDPDESIINTYLNHAHNDWLELYLETGFIGILIFCIFIFFICKYAMLAFRSSLKFQNEIHSEKIALSKLGVIMIFMLSIASIVDYPLRTPAIMCQFVTALVWLFSLSADSIRSRQQYHCSVDK